jgi:hypothetical protein
VPVTAIARQARRLDRKHGAHARLADCSEQAFEAGACDATTGAAKIIVDDLDFGPTELTGAIGERILPTSTLVIVHELIRR